MDIGVYTGIQLLIGPSTARTKDPYPLGSPEILIVAHMLSVRRVGEQFFEA